MKLQTTQKKFNGYKKINTAFYNKMYIFDTRRYYIVA